MSNNITITSLKNALSAYSSSHPRSLPQAKLILRELMSYVCRGIDISSLYENIILFMASNDAEIFKMTSQILIQYARLRMECAPMCINSFRREFVNEDPYIAQYSLRMLNYFEPGAYKAGLDHTNALVRNSALMSIMTDMKIHSVRLTLNLESTLKVVEEIKNKLHDFDSSVVISAVRLLNTIYQNVNWITDDIADLLIQRFDTYSVDMKAELMEIFILKRPSRSWIELCPKLLREPIIQNTYYNAVLTQSFLINPVDLTRNLKILVSRWIVVYKSGRISEINIALKCLHYLVQLGERNHPGFKSEVFPNSVLHIFFCDWYMPEDVQINQLHMLKMLATKDNADIIYNEIKNYMCTEITKFSRRAAQAVILSMKLAEFSENIKEELISMCCLLTKLPFFWFYYVAKQIYVDTQVRVPSLLPYLDDIKFEDYTFDFEAECLHAAGHFASEYAEIPDILETVITYFENLAEETPEDSKEIMNKSYKLLPFCRVLQGLLVASVKTYVKQPEEMESILRRVLDLLLNNPSVSFDVKERAQFYGSLLKTATEEPKILAELENILFKQLDEDEATSSKYPICTSLTFEDVLPIKINVELEEEDKTPLIQKIRAAQTVDDFIFLFENENSRNDETKTTIEEKKPYQLKLSDELPINSQLLNENEVVNKDYNPDSPVNSSHHLEELSNLSFAADEPKTLIENCNVDLDVVQKDVNESYFMFDEPKEHSPSYNLQTEDPYTESAAQEIQEIKELDVEKFTRDANKLYHSDFYDHTMP